jgi:hypothetical protein
LTKAQLYANVYIKVSMTETSKLPGHEHIAQPESHQIPDGSGVLLPLDGPPIARVTDANGVERDAIATFSLPDYASGPGDGGPRTTVYVSVEQVKHKKRTETRLVFTETDAHGNLKPAQATADAHAKKQWLDQDRPGYTFSATVLPADRRKAPPKVAAVTFAVSRHTAQNSAIGSLGDYTKNNHMPEVAVADDSPTPLAVAPQQELSEMARQAQADQRSQEKKRGLMVAAGRMAGALALAGALFGAGATGGGVDKALDLANKAGTHVETTHHSQNPERQAAVKRVARTMHDLDEHNNAAVTQRAAHFEAAHPGEFMSTERLQHIQEQLDQATTNQAVIQVLDEFIGFYNRNAALQAPSTELSMQEEPILAFDPATDVATTRAYAKGAVRGISVLPRSFVESARFETLEFGTPNANAKQQIGGRYVINPYDHRASKLRIALHEEVKDKEQASALTILHELAHAEHQDLDRHAHARHDATASEGVAFKLRHLLDIPEHVSEYAAINPGNETYADENAHMAVGGKNGLAHPDNTRLFKSKANHKLRERLITVDQAYPGYSDYLATRVSLASPQQYKWYVFGLN